MEKNQQNDPKDQNKQRPNKGQEDAPQPDPETLGTTDPQEHMKGPVSSFMQKIKDGTEKTADKAGKDEEDVFMPQKDRDKAHNK